MTVVGLVSNKQSVLGKSREKGFGKTRCYVWL